MNIKDYHADTQYLSKSTLDIFRRSPREYFLRKLHPELATPEQRQEWDADQFKEAFVFGDAFDRFLLEPEKFQDDFMVAAKLDMRYSKNRAKALELAQTNQGKRTIDSLDMSMIQAMKKAAKAHPIVGEILEKLKSGEAKTQTTITWTDADTGILCKARPDIHDNDGIITDIKTIDNLEEIGKHIVNFNYDIQASFYSDGYTEHFGVAPARFDFAFIEKSMTPRIKVVTLPAEVLEIGRNRYKADLRLYKTIMAQYAHDYLWPIEAMQYESGAIGDTFDTITEANLPGWYFSQNKQFRG